MQSSWMSTKRTVSPRSSRHGEPGRDVRVVVEPRHEDLVAGAQAVARERAREAEVERRHVRPEADLLRGRAEEARRGRARVIDERVGGHARRERSAGVRVRLLVGRRTMRLDDRVGHLGSGRPVEERGRGRPGRGSARGSCRGSFPRGEQLALAVRRRGRPAPSRRRCPSGRASRARAHSSVARTVSSSGRKRSPAAIAFDASMPKNAAQSGSTVGASQSGRSWNGSTPCSWSQRSSAQTSSAPSARRASARAVSPSVSGSAGPDRVEDPGEPVSAERRIHSARSRASTSCTGWARGSGASDVAAAGEPCDPVREAVGRVVRPDDQPGAHRERRARGAPRRALGEHLEAAVGLGRAQLLGRVGAEARSRGASSVRPPTLWSA